jgi:SAM-dependent methyltransferase
LVFVSRQQHWNGVYTTKAEREVSWFEASPGISMQMIEGAGLTSDSCVLDVGGGESRLVDALLDRGVTCIAVLDVAHAALDRARARLGDRAALVNWIDSDVTGEWSWKPVDLWHDRAVFHFLTERDDRQKYTARLAEMVKPGGSAIIATFALDGPAKCSGLPVVRYSPDSLASELGDRFALVDSRPHLHTTPWGATQAFQYSWFRKR